MWIELLIGVLLASSAAVFLARDGIAGKLAAALSLVPVAGSLWMYATFDASGNALLGGDLAFETMAQWVTLGPYALNWHVGVDGVSMPLIVLTTVLTTTAIVSAWTPIDERQSQFYGLVLFLEAGLVGVFSALDFFVWFVFWEAVLVPMYLLIGVWGGPRRKYAAIKFFVYTNIASLIMFIGFFALVFGLGDSIGALDLPAIAQALEAGELGPLAGVLLKMGTYALLRFNFTMLADVAAANAELIAIFAVVSVIYGAMLALAQRDLKRIVAYSSISSMGYVILGLVAYTTHGLGGATLQMISHGLISGLMFMSVGVIYNATHTRMVGDMSGLADRMPWTVGIFLAASFGYMGLPLMAGFAGEYLVFVGSFASTTLGGAPLFTGVAMFGIVIVAGYLLWAMQRTLFGQFEVETDYDIGPAPFHDVVPLAVLLVLVIALGVAPGLVYGMIQDAVNPMLQLGGGV